MSRGLQEAHKPALNEKCPRVPRIRHRNRDGGRKDRITLREDEKRDSNRAARFVPEQLIGFVQQPRADVEVRQTVLVQGGPHDPTCSRAFIPGCEPTPCHQVFRWLRTFAISVAKVASKQVAESICSSCAPWCSYCKDRRTSACWSTNASHNLGLL